MMRVFLAVAFLCFVGLSPLFPADLSNIQRQPIAVAEDGTNLAPMVDPPGGLATPRILIDVQGNLLERDDDPALSVTGALVLMALMPILGGYALNRRRTAQVP